MSEKRDRAPATRNRNDYIQIAAMFILLAVLGNTLGPFSSKAESQAIFNLIDVFGFGRTNMIAIFTLYFMIGIVAMSSATYACWLIMNWLWPLKSLPAQFNEIKNLVFMNMIILPFAQAAAEYTATLGWTRQTVLEPVTVTSVITSSLLWILGFEISWYTMHRACHDSKFLWKLGHETHHKFRTPEAMIGITNFAFTGDECAVTMLSAYISVIIFPVDFRVAKILGFCYLVLALFVHHDSLQFTRYHQNHHYLTTKNYGSHVPLFDWYFDTWQTEPYYPPKLSGSSNSNESKRNGAKVSSTAILA